MHQFMLPKIFQLLNVKNMKCTLPSPEIRPIIVGGAPLQVLSAPNKPHQGISSAQYFPHHQSSTYFEPGNEDKRNGISLLIEIVYNNFRNVD